MMPPSINYANAQSATCKKGHTYVSHDNCLPEHGQMFKKKNIENLDTIYVIYT